MTRSRRHTRLGWRSWAARALLTAVLAVPAATGLLLFAGRPALASTTAPSTSAAPAAAGAPSARVTNAVSPGPAPSGGIASNPTPIQVGPPGLGGAPAAPAPGSGGTVDGGGSSSPGLFDITGHITAAIDSWFRDVVTSALNPVLTVMGHTLLATPNLTGQSRVAALWRAAAGIADSLLVLLVLAGGAVVMAHETLQTRYAAKDILPRVRRW